jgi:hypothetical protein
MARRKLQRGVLALVLLTTAFLVAISYAQGSQSPPTSSSESRQIGKILSIRKVLRTPYFVSRLS